MRRIEMSFGVVCAALCLLQVPAAGEEVSDVDKLFFKAVDLFLIGRVKQARELLTKVLQLDPKAEHAHRLVQEAGETVMIQMMTEQLMGREPRIIYDLYRLHARRMKRSPEYIEKLVAAAVNPQVHPVKRWEAIHKLQDVGQFVVPFLVDALGNQRDHEARALARIAAQKMGRQAVLALIELLKLEPPEGALQEEIQRVRLIRENAALVLGDVPLDGRGLAALKAIFDNEKESPAVRKFVYLSLQKITGLAVEKLTSAQDYYYRKADRYLREISGVPAEATEADGVVWSLEEGKLRPRQIPKYVWNELIAEKACYDCIAMDPSYEPIYPVYANVIASRYAEVSELLDLSVERPGGRPFPEEDLAELKDRGKSLGRLKLLLYSLGAGRIYSGIDKALDDALAEGRVLPRLAACVLIDVVASLDPDGTMLPGGSAAPRGRRGRRRGAEAAVTEGASLIRALRFEDQRVRYAAAMTLARMNPEGPFDGAEEVVETLAAAVGEGGPLQLLVVEENAGVRNEMVGKLKELGYMVSAAAGAREGLSRARAFPPLDAMLISTNLQLEGDIEWLLKELKGDMRSSPIPVGILSSYDARDEHAEKFKGKPAVKAVVPIEDSGPNLQELVEKLAGARDYPIVTKRRAEAISVEAARALYAIEPKLARINGMKVEDCGEACLGALQRHADDLREACIKVLGKFGYENALPKLVALAKDTGQPERIRLAAVRAVGQIAPAKVLDELLELASLEEEFAMKELASQGYGRASAAAEKIKGFLEAMQLPLAGKELLTEEKGAGGE